MTAISNPYYKYHLFFCTNQREGKQCCADANANDLREYAKKRIKELELDGEGGVRINISGCLGRCSEGPIIAVYPEGVWYTYQNKADIDEIIESHLLKDEPVKRLKI